MVWKVTKYVSSLHINDTTNEGYRWEREDHITRSKVFRINALNGVEHTHTFISMLTHLQTGVGTLSI